MKKIKISAFMLNILMFIFLTTSVVFLCYSLLDFSKVSIINIVVDYFGILSIVLWLMFVILSTLTYIYQKKKRIRYLNCFSCFFCCMSLFILGFLGLAESVYFNNLEMSIFSSLIVLESYTCFGFVFIYSILSMYLTMESPKTKNINNIYSDVR